MLDRFTVMLFWPTVLYQDPPLATLTTVPGPKKAFPLVVVSLEVVPPLVATLTVPEKSDRFPVKARFAPAAAAGLILSVPVPVKSFGMVMAPAGESAKVPALTSTDPVKGV